ncbi:apolipoprotein A-I [Alligator sinensis]|uniref:Apolipoprotein A-I n=1 Tax=Alligator sinensis TaxID=38654 RepID=A0A1U7SH51_ALLSI|nr:apolipoprotein A-I [Alligator sinensis]
MRAIVVTLALVFLTGTQARYFWQHDDPQTRLDRFKDMLNVYMETMKASGKEVVAQFDASAVGKQLDLKVGDTLDSLSSTIVQMKEDLAPYYEEMRDAWDKETESLQSEVAQDLEQVRQKFQTALEQFAQQWGAEVDQYREKLVPVVSNMKELSRQKLELLQQQLTPLAEEAQGRMRGHVDELRKNLAPYKEELTQKIQKLHESFPYTSNVRDQAVQHLSSLREKVTPLVQDFRERVKPYTDSVKTHLLNLFQEARKTLS